LKLKKKQVKIDSVTFMVALSLSEFYDVETSFQITVAFIF